MNKYILVIILSILSSIYVIGQNNSFSRVESLISQGEYSAALDELSSLSTPEGHNVEYYRILCQMKLSPIKSCDMLDNFLSQYPSSPHRTRLISSMADALWDKSEYSLALKYYSMLDRFTYADEAQRSRHNYRLSYCQYATGDYPSARQGMYTLIESPTYGADATYIYAHICYSMGDISLAAEYFEKIKDHPRYKAKTNAYLSGIYLESGHWDKAIAAATAYLSSDEKSPQDTPSVKKNLAIAYFNHGDYDKCLPLLIENTGNSTPEDNEKYMIGYSYYRTGDYTNALSTLHSLLEKKCNYTQQSYFVVGDIYLKTGKKNMALDAFRSAAMLESEPSITENAWYNYAMLSYEIGNPYMSVSQVMKEYLNRYPTSTHSSQVYDYMVDSFLSSGEYEEAVKCIEGMSLNSDASREALQKASFYLASQKLEDRDLDAAIKYYIKSASQDYDPLLTARAYFWAGETYIRLGLYDEARDMYSAFNSHPLCRNTPEWESIDYQLGYLYSESRDYSLALKHFNSYLKKPLSKDSKADVQMRIGDCLFALGKYKEALSSYTAALGGSSVPLDYLSYQRTICMGIMGDYASQVKSLNNFLDQYPDSPLRSSVRYDLGVAYQRLNQNDKAIDAFLSIEKEESASNDLIAQGKSRAAAAYYNRGDSERSLSLYKEVVEKYPSSPVMPQSMRWARQISVERGESDNFIQWSQNVNSTPIDMLSMDSLQWETARKFYIQKDYPTSIIHLNRYTEKYPTGVFLPDVIYSRGESYLAIADTASAKKDYLTLSSQKGGKHTEAALYKYIDIMIKQDSAYYALPQIEELYNIATHDDNRKYAAINALGIYYDEQDWEGVKRYADIIRSQYKNDSRLYADATVALYATLVEEEKYEEASQLTDDVMRVAVDENMARGLYYRARIEYNEKKYETSIKTITYLCSQYPMYKYIGARSLILLAQNYYATGDTYQSGYILDNVISSTTYSDIRNEATLINEYIKSKNTDK